MSRFPTISIVTPSYNQGQFIEETIRSVLLQDYPDLEYIIIDGGSTDGSVEIIRKYADRLDYWVSEKDSGSAHAINKGFARAHGDLFAWLNSDDFLLPGAISRIVEMHNEHPTAVAWVGGCYRIDPNGRILSVIIPEGLNRDCLADWGHRALFYQPSCFFAAQAWYKIGPLDENLHYAFDLELWLRLSSIGAFAHTTEIISAAIIHKNAKTQAHRLEMDAETIAVQIKHGYREAGINRLARLLNKPSWNCRIKNNLRAALRDMGHSLGIRSENEEPQHIKFPSVWLQGNCLSK